MSVHLFSFAALFNLSNFWPGGRGHSNKWLNMQFCTNSYADFFNIIYYSPSSLDPRKLHLATRDHGTYLMECEGGGDKLTAL